MLEKINAILAKESLSDEEINFLLKNIDFLSRDAKIRLGLILPEIAPVIKEIVKDDVVKDEVVRDEVVKDDVVIKKTTRRVSKKVSSK